MTSNTPLVATKGVPLPVPACSGNGEEMRWPQQVLRLILCNSCPNPSSGIGRVALDIIVQSSCELIFPSVSTWTIVWRNPLSLYLVEIHTRADLKWSLF